RWPRPRSAPGSTGRSRRRGSPTPPRSSQSGSCAARRVCRTWGSFSARGALRQTPGSLSEARPMRAPILALKDVRLADGPLMLFDGVDLALDARVRACLVGRNGAGKSTLLRILAGQVEPDGGERHVSAGTRIAFVPQEPEIVGATLLDYATAGGAQDYQAQATLTDFGLDPEKAAT